MPRARSFDEDGLLDAAVELFWVHGYNAVSLADISRETGVANGSLYQAFGSKWELFLAAFRKYCTARIDAVAAAIQQPATDVGAAVDNYFDAILGDCAAHPDRRGCLMLNAIAELGGAPEVAEIVSAAIARMHTDVANVLGALAARDAQDASVATSAVHVVTLSQGMIHLSRVGTDPMGMRQVGRQTAAAVRQALQSAA